MKYKTEQSFKRWLKKLDKHSKRRFKSWVESGNWLVLTQDAIDYTNRHYTMHCACGYEGKAGIVAINVYSDGDECGESYMACPSCGSF